MSTDTPAPPKEIKATLQPDIMMTYRSPAETFTRVAVHWTPNGFIVKIEPVTPDNHASIGALEGPQALAVKLPFMLRRIRKAIS